MARSRTLTSVSGGRASQPMGKVKAYVIRDGRPSLPQGAGRRAPVVTLRLDAETEAALAALATVHGKGAPAAPALAREAIVGWTHSRHPTEYEASLARVRRRREREAS